MKELIKQSFYIWNCCKVLVTWIAICEASCHTKFLVFYFACFNLLVFYIIYIYIYKYINIYIYMHIYIYIYI